MQHVHSCTCAGTLALFADGQKNWMACPCSAMTHYGEIGKPSFHSLTTPSSESSIITLNNLVQAGMQRQVNCLMAKEILISTFQLKCNILSSLPTNSVSIEQMVDNCRPAGHSMPLSSRLLNTEAWKQHREWQSFCATVRFMPSISCCLAETKPVSYLHSARARALFAFI